MFKHLLCLGAETAAAPAKKLLDGLRVEDDELAAICLR